MSYVSEAAAEPPRETQGGFLALMRHRNYALLWTGQLISQVGDRFHWVAISLWVYAQTGSALSVSYAMMALLAGSTVVGPFAGVLVDRMDRRKILVYSDLSRAALIFAIPDLMELGLIWVYVDLFLVSIATAFFRPAMFAAIPQSVPKDSLLQANAFFASMSQSTEVFGPALAGLLIAWRHYPAAIYLNAVSFLVSAIFVSALRLQRSSLADDAEKKKAEGTLRSIEIGFRYIRADPVQVALLALLVGGFWVVGLTSLQTPMAKGVLAISDREFGWFQGIWGVGFVVGSLLLGWYGGRLPKGQTIVFGYLLWSLATGLMGLSANYVMLVVTGFWVGFANMLVFVNVATVMMEHTPSDKIGRAIATRQILVAAMSLTAMLAFGWFADLVSVRTAILVMAAISLVGTVWASVRFSALWRYRTDSEYLRRLDGSASQASHLPHVVSGVVAQFLEAHTSPELAVPGQRLLNAASLLIVGLGWLALLSIVPIPALGVATVVGTTLVVAVVLRSIRMRFIPLLRRPEDGRSESRAFELREGKPRRMAKGKTTGPTA